MKPCEWCPFKACLGCTYQGGTQGNSRTATDRLETQNGPGWCVNTSCSGASPIRCNRKD